MQDHLILAIDVVKRWIASCETKQQIATVHGVICNLIDAPYKIGGTPESNELHALCFERLKQIEPDADIFNLDEPGKD